MESRSTLLGRVLHVGGDDFDLVGNHLATAYQAAPKRNFPCVLALIVTHIRRTTPVATTTFQPFHVPCARASLVTRPRIQDAVQGGVEGRRMSGSAGRDHSRTLVSMATGFSDGAVLVQDAEMEFETSVANRDGRRHYRVRDGDHVRPRLPLSAATDSTQPAPPRVSAARAEVELSGIATR